MLQFDVNSCLFTARGKSYSLLDAILFAWVDGRFEAFEAKLFDCLALKSRKPRPDEEENQEIDDKAFDFCRGLNLNSAQAAFEWLANRGLDSDSLYNYCEREWYYERYEQEARPINSEFEINPHKLRTALIENGFFSGFFAEIVSEFAIRLALPAVTAVATTTSNSEELLKFTKKYALDCSDLSERLQTLIQLKINYDEFKRQALTSEALSRELDLNQVNWTKVAYDLACFVTEKSAQRAIEGINEEGKSLNEIAEQTCAAVINLVHLLEEFDLNDRRKVYTKHDGEIVGPLQIGGGYGVLHLKNKLPPSLTDSETLKRAEQKVIRRLSASLVSQEIKWDLKNNQLCRSNL